ncbi:hypothetical protein [Runella sp.]|uniref:hypothetical protein n=1 Tax=Runella sp. TaxID=1960881 RepID=UPI003D0B9600
MNHLTLHCPISGLDTVLYEKSQEDFKGICYVIPSISEQLLIFMADNVLQNSELRNTLIEHREKFVKNLEMVSKLRQETVVSSGNWWLFMK